MTDSLDGRVPWADAASARDEASPWGASADAGDASRRDLRAPSALAHNLTDGVIVCDLSGRFLVYNPAAERILGMPAIDASPDAWSFAYGCYLPDGKTPFPAEDLPLVRALRGEATTGVEIFIRNEGVPKGAFLSVSAGPVRAGSGVVRGAVVIFRDATAQREAFEAIRRLSSAVEQTADSVVITDRSGAIQYVNPAFEETTGYSASEALGRNPRFLKSGEHEPTLYKRLWSTILSGESFRGVLTNRKKSGELYPAEQTITPIKGADGTITHFVSVLRDLSDRKKREEQEAEIRLARVVQKRLYPRSDPAIDGFDIAGATFPAGTLCGDCFDYVPMPGDRLGIVVGDVCGHGFGPAIRMAEVRAYLRAYARMTPDAEEILGLINKDLITVAEERLFVTMLVVRLDPGARSLVYANAGHTSGYLIAASGEVKEELASTGTALGLFPDSVFPSSRTIPVEEGDILVLATDGITECEAPDGTFLDASGLLGAARAQRHGSAREILSGIHEAARAFAGERGLADDITLVVCKVGKP